MTNKLSFWRTKYQGFLSRSSETPWFFLLLLFGMSTSALAGGPSLVTFTLPGPNGQGGLYYIDLQASFPEVNWSELDRLYVPAAHYRYLRLGNLPDRSPDRPLVITNSGGQVRVGGLDFYYNLSVSGGSNWKLSGRWDPTAAIGDSSYPGHGNGDYARSRDRYGFLIDDAFQGVESGLTISDATDFELEFIEIRHVGFAGTSIKTNDDGSAHMENVRIHDLYIHDTGSEGVYIGSTQAEPQHKISGLQFYNNRLIRTGTEALQIGQLGGDSEVHHNTIVFGAISWKNPFQVFQDSNSQLGCREGSANIHHNIVIGGASNFFIMFSQSNTGDVHLPTDLVNLHDNYYSHGRNIGAYLHSIANGVTTLRFENNFFREINFQYDELNPGSFNHNAVFRIFNTLNPVELIDNTWEGPQTFAQVAGSNVSQAGNLNLAVSPVIFRNSGFPSNFDYLLLETWTDLDLNGAAVTYQESDWVMHEGLLYECIETGQHTNKVPPDHPGTWELRPLLPDDFRLGTGSPYPGFGLLDDGLIFRDGFESGDLGFWSSSN